MLGRSVAAVTDDVLLVSTSPRSTWIWAPDTATCDRVRAALTASASTWREAVRYGEPVENVTDVEIGWDATQACEALAASGFSFGWHPDQFPMNRSSRRLGVSIPGSVDE